MNLLLFLCYNKQKVKGSGEVDSFEEYAILAKKASYKMACISTEEKNNALLAMRDALLENADRICEANKNDMAMAEENNLAMPLQKRLFFDRTKLRGVCDGLDSLVALKDPVGTELLKTELDEGFILRKISCPIGVIGVIFESRPDALVQIASLCLKSGNSVCLKGGSEAMQSNRALFDVISKATIAAGLPEGWITLMESRSDVEAMLGLNQYIDLIIPRGSNAFVQYIMQHSSIPVLGHADGVCHLYIDKDADQKMALDLAIDGKTQYVAVCNATETLLIHEEIANEFLPKLAAAFSQKHVIIHGDDKVAAMLGVSKVEEWHHEYLDYEISVKIVGDMEEAIAHNQRVRLGHTDAIVTKNEATAERFMDAVDSGNVYWNCSTRFSDGFKYGFGAEVGVSTSKLHARGPVGLEGLVTYKYKISGHGELAGDYAEGKKHFTHRPLATKE